MEAEVDGYIIDLVQGEKLVEIQTANFGALKDKLKALLPHYAVHLIYPIAVERHLIYIDPQTGGSCWKEENPRKKRYNLRIICGVDSHSPPVDW